MVKKTIQYIVFLVGMFMASWAVSSPLKVTITNGNISRTDIAIMPFYMPQKTPHLDKIATDIRDIIMNNLENSGLFVNVDEMAFLQTPKDVATKGPDFSKWMLVKTDALLSTELTVENTSKGVQYKLLVTLWDVSSSKALYSNTYSMSDVAIKRTPNLMRRYAHVMSDDIYTRITGEGKYFDSEVVFVAEDYDENRQKRKRLAIMDQDGANIRYLTSGTDWVVTPRFSPDGNFIAYLSYRKQNITGGNNRQIQREVAGITLRDRYSLKQKFIKTPGKTFYAPQFSPDSKYMILSVLSGRSSDLWVVYNAKKGNALDVSGQLRAKKLLSRPANTDYVDTTPYYSPDGKNIVFVSDRTGTAQLYTMTANGKNVRRISGGGGQYTTPVWSPRGDKIAFTKSLNGRFHIGIMNTDGTGEQLLTGSYFSEGPTFSPNGRVIMFSRQTKDTDEMYLMSVDITGKNERRLSPPKNASDPNWSKLR